MKWHDKRKGWVEDAKSGKAKEEHSHHPQINRQAAAAAHVFERSESLVNHVNTGERLYVSHVFSQCFYSLSVSTLSVSTLSLVLVYSQCLPCSNAPRS